MQINSNKHNFQLNFQSFTTVLKLIDLVRDDCGMKLIFTTQFCVEIRMQPQCHATRRFSLCGVWSTGPCGSQHTLLYRRKKREPRCACALLTRVQSHSRERVALIPLGQ